MSGNSDLDWVGLYLSERGTLLRAARARAFGRRRQYGNSHRPRPIHDTSRGRFRRRRVGRRREPAGGRQRDGARERQSHIGTDISARADGFGLDFGDERMLARKQALAVTDAAAQRIQALLAKRGKPSVGVRVGVRSRGCSGLSYTIEYADERGKYDEVVEDKGVKILVDPKA